MAEDNSECGKLHEVDRRALLWTMLNERSSFLYCVDYTLEQYNRNNIAIDKDKLIEELIKMADDGKTQL